MAIDGLFNPKQLLVPKLVTAKATSYGVTAADVGTMFTNEGATAQVNFTLPTAVAGLHYWFSAQDADGVKVTAASGDTLRMGSAVTPAAGDVQSSAIGDTVLFVAKNATEWYAVSGFTGAWTVSE